MTVRRLFRGRVIRHAPAAVAWLAVLSGGAWLGQPASADMATAQAAIGAGNFPAAGAALQPLAEGGDPQAEYQWAALALDGHPVGLAPDRAISLLIQSAAQGNGHAQARLGMAYANGDHIVADNFAAYHWLSRASAAPDLTDAERSNVDSLRQSLLQQLAPTQQSNADLIAANAAAYAAIPAADRADAAPPDSISAAHLTPPPPLPPVTDDVATDAPDNAGPKKARSMPASSSSSAAASSKKAKTSATVTAKPAVTEIATAAALPADPAPASSQTHSYLVQLASLPTETAANAEAARLRKKYAALLQGSEITVHAVDLGAKGVFQRVVVGPFDTFSDAKARCGKFNAQKQNCRVISVTN